MHHDVRTDDSREMNQNVRYTTFCSLRVEHCITARKIKLRYKKLGVWRKAQAYSRLPSGRKRGRPKAQRLRKKVSGNFM